MKTITEQELEELKRVHSEFNSLKGKIADAEIEIKKLNIFKEDLFSKIESVSNDFKEQEKKLLDTYGKVSINLQTGEITDDKN
jgi:predicted  nucleic acid-binding Zn-ribbon protein